MPPTGCGFVASRFLLPIWPTLKTAYPELEVDLHTVAAFAAWLSNVREQQTLTKPAPKKAAVREYAR
jgi:hypothetical protein